MVAALATMMAACNNDDENVVNDGPVAAQVYAEINNAITTRTAEEKSWSDNDEIGISTIVGTTAATKYSNVPYIYKAPQFGATAPIYFQDTEEVAFCAYYPYANTTDNGIEVSTANQPATKSLDYMYATGAKASKSSPTINFSVDNSFKHKMSQLVFTFKPGAGIESLDKLTELNILGVVNTGKFNISDGSIENAENTKDNMGITVKSFKTSDTSDKDRTATVFLLPQDAPISSGKFDIELMFDGQKYVAHLTLPANAQTANSKFTEGVSVSYDITINKTNLKVGDATINSWVSEKETGTAAME